MKKIAILTLAVTLSLGSCATTGGITPSSVQSVIASVQSAAVQACGFLPTASTVSAILASFVPGGSAVEASVASVAQQICTAVLPLKAKLGKRLGGIAPPTVNGIVIHGRFVS
jgi:hypothetical protein